MNKEHSDIDVLLDSAFEEMKISEDREPTKEPTNDARTEYPMAFDLKGSGADECPPSKIQESLDKLLAMTKDDDLAGLALDSDIGDIDNLIEQMMSELTSKELLAEPFSDMAKAVYYHQVNEKSLEPDQKFTYTKQCDIVCKIDALFKDSNFDVEKHAHQQKIFDLMKEMQELGSPPEDMLREIDMGTDKAQQTPPDCVQM